MKRVLVACEESGKVRARLRRLGLDAWSCDLKPARDGSKFHLQLNVRKALKLKRWDAVIAFPPCTDLAVSGARWFKEKRRNGSQKKSINFFLLFTRLKCPWAIENPVGIMSTIYRKPDQVVQPWQFGHGEIKATCFWLNGLPPLVPTKKVRGRVARVHRMAPGPDRAMKRSETYDGIADAIASQWSRVIKRGGDFEN